MCQLSHQSKCLTNKVQDNPVVANQSKCLTLTTRAIGLFCGRPLCEILGAILRREPDGKATSKSRGISTSQAKAPWRTGGRLFKNKRANTGGVGLC